MSDVTRTIKIFSTSTMPKKAGKVFLDIKCHSDEVDIAYTLGSMSDVDDPEDMEEVAELEAWLKEHGAQDGETVILHHGGFHWDE